MKKSASGRSWRISAIRLFFIAFLGTISFKLFSIQVLGASFYNALADGRHTLYEELVPERGRIFVKDFNDPTEYPVATTTQKGFVYADPRKVKDPVVLGTSVAKILSLPGLDEGAELELIASLERADRITDAKDVKKQILEKRGVMLPENIDDIPALFESELKEHPNAVQALIARLSKKDDPYEPVAHGVSQEQLELLKGLGEEALTYDLENARSYPEPDFGGHVLGFLGKDDKTKPKGFYGIEGFFNDFLSGTIGTLYSQVSRSGALLGVGGRQFTPAVDGGDVLLTIDRTVQVKACAILKEAVSRYEAKGGALVIMEPKTGAVIAMCGFPDFDPATYGKVDDFSVYNNPAIFTPYEPGSIIKPLTMAAALDVDAVKPESTFTDTGSVDVDDVTIKNANDKIFGTVSMIEVLEQSINTGMVWTMRHMGRDVLREYFTRYGFGALTGIELKSESTGTIAPLNEPAEVYAATAAFGQGVTMTPIQIVAAFAALANGGTYMKPHIVSEFRHADGTIEQIAPEPVRQVISAHTSTTIGAMLVSVVEYGHGKKAGVPGYYVAGKTGTAQVASHGKYSETAFNGSFAGYAPVHDPKFAMIVKIEEPKDVLFAEATAAPVFGKIAKFLLEYYGIAPERKIE
ncbi:MAG: penicillin-binding protein 2 [Patescibacteria group bacterium]|jgi:cell division protein FtsI/penicillin-binding protein 2